MRFLRATAERLRSPFEPNAKRLCLGRDRGAFYVERGLKVFAHCAAACREAEAVARILEDVDLRRLAIRTDRHLNGHERLIDLFAVRLGGPERRAVPIRRAEQARRPALVYRWRRRCRRKPRPIRRRRPASSMSPTGTGRSGTTPAGTSAGGTTPGIGAIRARSTRCAGTTSAGTTGSAATSIRTGSVIARCGTGIATA